jgi:hypothetical protein
MGGFAVVKLGGRLLAESCCIDRLNPQPKADGRGNGIFI